ncbi:MAG: hypothetical protein HY421_02775 [Candidatus Kerfeldbacteria bacterium]|nr:hypothetical protein [Candidatus Kerfeldbacteria bacterium]
MTPITRRNGLTLLLLCFGLVVAVMVTVMPQHLQANSSPDNAAFAATPLNPPNAATTSEVVVLGDQVACSWTNTTTNAISDNFDNCDATVAICPGHAQNVGNMFADVIWSAGSAPPLDVGSSDYALTPMNSTGASNGNVYATTTGTDSEALVTKIAMREDGTHRFTAART